MRLFIKDMGTLGLVIKKVLMPAGVWNVNTTDTLQALCQRREHTLNQILKSRPHAKPIDAANKMK